MACEDYDCPRRRVATVADCGDWHVGREVSWQVQRGPGLQEEKLSDAGTMAWNMPDSTADELLGCSWDIGGLILAIP